MKKLMNYLSIVLILVALVLFNLDNFQCAKVSQPIKLSQLEMSIQQTIGSVVHIVNNTQGWQGSGVAIRPDLILTARHLVEGGEDFTVTTNNGIVVKATKALSSKKYDVGFIKIAVPILVPVQLGSIKECRLGQSVYVIGSPYGKLNFNSVTLGIISGLNRNWDYWTGYNYDWKVTFTTDSAGHPGNSGCPIFTMDGKVRGVLVGGVPPVLIYCIPVDVFMGNESLIDMLFALDEYELEKQESYSSYDEFVEKELIE